MEQKWAKGLEQVTLAEAFWIQESSEVMVSRGPIRKELQ